MIFPKFLSRMHTFLFNFKKRNFLAKLTVGSTEPKSTNVKLTANNCSLTTLANRRWSNFFSLSPRHQHGRSSNLDLVNTSSNDNSINNLTTSSASSHETAIHTVMAPHDEAKRTEFGAISAALPVMLCGLTRHNMMPKTQFEANDAKNSVDDNTDQPVIATANANLGISLRLLPEGERKKKVSRFYSRFELFLFFYAQHS